MSRHQGNRLRISCLRPFLLLATLTGAVFAGAADVPLPPHEVEYQLSRNGLTFASVVARLEQEKAGSRFEMELLRIVTGSRRDGD